MQKHTHSFVFFLSFYFCYLTRTLRHIRKNIQKVFSALEFDIVWSNYLNAVKPKSTVTRITEALKCFFTKYVHEKDIYQKLPTSAGPHSVEVLLKAEGLRVQARLRHSAKG